MQTFRFQEFPVYVKARGLYLSISTLTDALRDYAVKDQIRRASLSIVLNIAEGSAKQSDKDFARFLQVALGSVNEVAACLDVLVNKQLIPELHFGRLMIECESIAKQLGGLSKKLRSGF